MSGKYDNLYYHGMPKKCNNCFYLKRFGFFSRCNKYPAWLTSDALKSCQYKEWVPNEKLYQRFEK